MGSAMPDRLLINHLLNDRWALHVPVLKKLAAVIARHAAGQKLNAIQIQQVISENRDAQAHDNFARRFEVGSGSDEMALAETPGHGWYQLCEGIAVIPIGGVIAKHASQVNGMSQPEGTSCEAIAAAVTHAVETPAVNAIMLSFYSPGGSIEGVADL